MDVLDSIKIVVYEDDLKKIRDALNVGLRYLEGLAKRDGLGSDDVIYKRDFQVINDGLVKVDILLSNFN